MKTKACFLATIYLVFTAFASLELSTLSEGAELSQKRPKVGETFKTTKLEITVAQVETRNRVGDEFMQSQAAEGAVYVIVRWKYKNISKKPLDMFSQPTLKLLDPEGVQYEPDIGATASYATQHELTEKIFSDLNPGITVTGAEVFEVGKNLFKKDTWFLSVNADEDIVVRLK